MSVHWKTSGIFDHPSELSELIDRIGGLIYLIRFSPNIDELPAELRKVVYAARINYELCESVFKDAGVEVTDA